MDAYPQVGAIVAGRYRIEGLLGEGGMGAVFRAVDANGNAFALKFPAPEIRTRPGMMSRFANEAQAAARIASEHAVHIFGVEATETGVPFIVMEVLQGVDLDRVIEAQAPIDVPRAVHFGLQILRALQVAHAAGVVHRDMKPSNCFVIPTPQDPELVKLIDFGITKILGDDAPNMTRTSVTMGTPAYMAPEQARSAKSAEPRSDLYSVGVILYELLTKRRPFEGESGNELVVKICTEPPLPILTLRPDLPPGLASAIERALVKMPGSRFANAAAFADALKPFADARSSAVLGRIEGGVDAQAAHQPSGSGGSTAVMVGGPMAAGAAAWSDPGAAVAQPAGPQRTVIADAPLGLPDPASPAPRPGATVIGDAPAFPDAPGGPAGVGPSYGAAPAMVSPAVVSSGVPPMPPVESMGGRRSSSGGRGGLIAVLGVAAAALIGTGIYFAVAGSSGSSSEPTATASGGGDEGAEGDEGSTKKKKKKKSGTSGEEGEEGDEEPSTPSKDDEPSDPVVAPPTPAAATVAPKPTATGTSTTAPSPTDAEPPAADAAPAPTTTTSTTTTAPTIFIPPGWPVPKKPPTTTTPPPATTTAPPATTATPGSTPPKLPPIKFLPKK